MSRSKDVMDTCVPLRKKGRPAGKNRKPLNDEERKARNAQYERERRNEQADAMKELADAMGVPGLHKEELLATVVNYMQKAEQADSLETLRSRNQKLLEQIQNIEHRIETDPLLSGLCTSELLDDSTDTNPPKRHCPSYCGSNSPSKHRVGHSKPNGGPRHGNAQFKHKGKRMNIATAQSVAHMPGQQYTQVQIPQDEPYQYQYNPAPPMNYIPDLPIAVPMCYPSPPESTGSGVTEAPESSWTVLENPNAVNYGANWNIQGQQPYVEPSYEPYHTSEYHAQLPPSNSMPVNLPPTSESTDILGADLSEALQDPFLAQLTDLDAIPNWTEPYRNWSVEDFCNEYL